MRGARGTQPRPASAKERTRDKTAWQRRWEATLRKLRHRHRATAWQTPWKQEPHMLYAGLSKAETTALFLMKTEVLGLNACLASVGVPEVLPTCPCGWHAQTVRHVLLHCPNYDRVGLLRSCGTERLEEMLTRHECVKHVACWWIASEVMEQFRLAKEIGAEDITGYRPFSEEERGY